MSNTVSYGAAVSSPVGTPLFTAPEILCPHLYNTSSYNGAAADVWSMGVILYSMVVGTLPFRAKTLRALREEITSCDIHIPAFVNASLKVRVLVVDTVFVLFRDVRCVHRVPARQALILSMLTTDPDKRPTADDVWRHAWLQGEASLPHMLPVTPRLDPSASKDAVLRLSSTCGTPRTGEAAATDANAAAPASLHSEPPALVAADPLTHMLSGGGTSAAGAATATAACASPARMRRVAAGSLQDSKLDDDDFVDCGYNLGTLPPVRAVTPTLSPPMPSSSPVQRRLDPLSRVRLGGASPVVVGFTDLDSPGSTRSAADALPARSRLSDTLGDCETKLNDDIGHPPDPLSTSLVGGEIARPKTRGVRNR